MSLDYEAIFTAYPECTGVADGKAFKGDEDITSTLEQTKIDDARVELDKVKYKTERVNGIGSTSGYPGWEEQMDMLYHDIADGKLGIAATTGSWYVGITSIKTNIPKPS